MAGVQSPGAAAVLAAMASPLQGHRDLPSFYRGDHDDQDDHDVDAVSEALPRRPPHRAVSASPPRSHNTSIPHHEDLLKRGRLMKERKEALRERSIHVELSNCREKPKITSKAASKVYDRPYHVRAQEHAEQKRRDADAARAAAEIAASSQSYTFSPRITRKGKQAKGKAQTVTDQGAQAKKIGTTTDEQKLVEDLAECVFQPEINSRSAKLAERQKMRLGAAGVGGLHFAHADSLVERSRLARMKKAYEHQLDLAEMQPGTPAISGYAASLQFSDPVTDRLYAQRKRGKSAGVSTVKRVWTQ